MKRSLSVLLIGLLSLLFMNASSSISGTKPNVIIIYMDDMGYGDLGSYGALGYETPNIDQMAVEGTRFTNFLTAQAICTASRAALLTGCYPNRIGMVWALMPSAKIGISDKEKTLAEILKERGYKTGIIGKWHLGHHKPFLPLQHGFDEYFGLPYSNDMWPVQYDGFTPATEGPSSKFPPLQYIEGNDKKDLIKDINDQAEITKKYTEKALSYIKRHKDEPFFLYLPYSMPHVPINASSAFKGKSKRGLYGDMIMELDWSVGQILKSLKQHKIDQNTFIILSSDNGPWIRYGNHAGSTGGFREGKAGSFEGGMRVPCIMRWPSKIPAGKVNNQLCSTIDIVPSIAKICGAKLSENKIDGLDLSDLFLNKTTVNPRKNFLYYYKANSLQAVRIGDWKLVLEHEGLSYEGHEGGLDGYPGRVTDNKKFPMALYNLQTDPSESKDLQHKFPEKVKELLELAESARADLGDEITGVKASYARKSGVIEK
jgi:arylsulfatase A-like enzyme